MDNENPYFTVKPSPGKGRGLFAKAAIPHGTRILAESPILRHGLHNLGDVLFAFEELPKADKKAYFQLTAHFSERFRADFEANTHQPWDGLFDRHKKVMEIFAANAFGKGGVVLRGSLFNHSCTPNVHADFNEKLDMMTFHAVRDIGVGEELTIRYVYVSNRTREKRMEDLQLWGFTCSCSTCEDTEEARKSDERRMQILLWDIEARSIGFKVKDIGSASYRQAIEKVLSINQKIAAMLKIEGILGRDLSQAYREAAEACMELGHTKMALAWAEKEYDNELCCIGEDHPDFDRVVTKVSRFRFDYSGVVEFIRDVLAPKS